MPPKSIFRQPGAKHFQLVHRSQRDPLINDPEASSHVLKPVERENLKKGKSRPDVKSFLASDDASSHEKIGEATLYGIYFDDTEYDYMQHLRTVGAQEDGVESILIEAPTTSKRNQKVEFSSRKGSDALELPEGVLPSASEVPRNFETQQAIPDSIAGFQPDMDPHLRQVLEALDDDAFVDDDLDNDFFSKLVAEGERESDEDINFEFTAEGINESEDNVEEYGWEKRFSDFKARHENNQAGDSDDSEDDTVHELPAISVPGGKKGRRKGSSEASGYSMSSSSMYRNEALQTLDERFDQIMLKEYHQSDDQDDMCKDGEESDQAPELLTSRNDFDFMVNDFLNNYEILGRQMKLKIGGETGPEKLDTLRRAMGQDEQLRIADPAIEDDEENFVLSDQEDEKEKWDCETVLTTYTTLGNHPRLIRARDSKPVPKFQLDHKTGLPVILSAVRPDREKSLPTLKESNYYDETGPTQTITRPRNESTEDKKTRKAAVKQERRSRRTEKKIMKQRFGIELREQKKRLGTEQNVKKL